MKSKQLIPKIYHDKVLQLYQTGNWRAARENARQLVRMYPRSALLWNVLGASELQLQYYKDAKISFTNALRNDPSDPAILNNIGVVNLKLEEYEECLKFTNKALKLNPKFPQAFITGGNALRHLGMINEAIDAFQSSIDLNPALPESHFNIGQLFFTQSRFAEAEKHFRKALDLNPKYEAAYQYLALLHLKSNDIDSSDAVLREGIKAIGNSSILKFEIGNIFRMRGRIKDAVTCYEAAIGVNPEMAEAYSNLGCCLSDLDLQLSAKDMHDKAIELRPNNAQFHNNLGVVLKRLEQFSRAAESFSKAIELKPDFADAYTNLGNTLREIGDLASAEKYCRYALKLQPNSATAYDNLGVVLRDLGRLNEAMDCHKEAIRLDSTFANAMSNLGVVQGQLGDVEESIATLRRAISVSSQCLAAYINLGHVEGKIGRYLSAEKTLREAISINPNSKEALSNLANILWMIGKLAEAESLCREAIRISPTYADAHANLANILSARGKSAESLVSHQEAIRLKPEDSKMFSNYLYTILYTDSAPEEIFSAQKRFADKFEKKWEESWPTHINNPIASRKLKVGYVSGDFKSHSVSSFLKPILHHYDKREFEVYAYSNNFICDAVTEEIRQMVDEWIPCAHMNDQQLFEKIKSDGIDILVDLSGHTALNRLTVFARKPSPIQVTWIGYPGSTGLEAIDYRITNHSTDPFGLTESLHSEKLIRLPDTAIPFHPILNSPEIGKLPALSRDQFTFACLNNHAKITESAIRVWVNLVKAVPNSRFLLGNAGDTVIRGLLSDSFRAAGISPERLISFPRLPFDKYMALYGSIDLCVDPFPYSGGTTTMQALWMGVPVVTMTGDTPHSRVGALLLNRVGLKSFVAKSAEEYIDIAKSWSKNLDDLNAIRFSMRKRLFTLDNSGESVTRLVEGEFRRIWSRWCESQQSS